MIPHFMCVNACCVNTSINFNKIAEGGGHFRHLLASFTSWDSSLFVVGKFIWLFTAPLFSHYIAVILSFSSSIHPFQFSVPHLDCIVFTFSSILTLFPNFHPKSINLKIFHNPPTFDAKVIIELFLVICFSMLYTHLR